MEISDIVIHKGEKDKKYQLYVEDYVMSYLKKYGKAQRNRRIFFFGTKDSDGKKYHLYGAGLQRQISYFEQMEYLGEISCRFEMDMPIFFVQERNRNYELSGYFIFYQTNEAMQNYMIEQRKEQDREGIPQQPKNPEEESRQTKRALKTEQRIQNIKKQRQTEREEEKEGSAVPDKSEKPKMQMRNLWQNKKSVLLAVQLTAVFIILAAIIINATNSYDKLEDLNQAAVEVFFAMENEDAAEDNRIDSLAATDNITEDAVEIENNSFVEEAQGTVAEDITEDITEEVLPEGKTLYLADLEEQIKEEEVKEEQGKEEAKEEEVNEEIKQSDKYYQIKKGDTLYTISQKEYGNTLRVREICELNQIEDPDNIKYGQKILLP